MDKQTKDAMKRADKARNFPTGTCPASRHAQMIGENLARKKPYPMLSEEPDHCGGSILSTVASLWEARAEIERLRGLLLRACHFIDPNSHVHIPLNATAMAAEIRRVVEQHRVGEYVADYTPLTEAEMNAPNPELDELMRNSRPVSEQLPFREPRTPILRAPAGVALRCPVCGNEDQDQFLTVTGLSGTELQGAVCGPCEDRLENGHALTAQSTSK